MPWKESSAACEQRAFVEAWTRGEDPVAGLCRRFGISRKTGHKRISRYRQYGMEGIGDRSRAPHSHPNRTSVEIARRLIEAKGTHPTWGPKKVVAWLRMVEPEVSWPAASTAGRILERVGLVKRRRRRRATSRWSEPFAAAEHANDVWCMDFKGWIRTADGKKIDPLTVQDASSRYLLVCRGLEQPRGDQVRRTVRRAFGEYGLPGSIRTDNGTPFASVGLGGLSRLGVWWVKLGIVPERGPCGRTGGSVPGRHKDLQDPVWTPGHRPAGCSQQSGDTYTYKGVTYVPGLDVTHLPGCTRVVSVLMIVLLASMVLAACASSEAEPQITEVVREVIKEVPVEKEVIKEVIKEVDVETEVIKEIIKDVPVEKEVVKTQIVVATPAPAAVMMVAESDRYRYGGTLRVVSQASIKSLDPDFCKSYVCWAPSAGHMIEPLMAQGADFSTQPMLLESWDVSDDGNTWTLNLREGIKFHDGTPLTSEVAILSQQRALSGTPAGEVLSGFLVEDGLQAVDDLTFTVETSEPYGSLLDGFGLRTHGNVLVYTPTAAAFPMTEDVGRENIIGTGPYQLDSWDLGVKVTLARNEDYQSRSEPASWLAGEKKAYVDKIEWLEIPSEETKVAGLKTGEWDFIDSIGLDFVANLEEDPDVGFT